MSNDNSNYTLINGIGFASVLGLCAAIPQPEKKPDTTPLVELNASQIFSRGNEFLKPGSREDLIAHLAANPELAQKLKEYADSQESFSSTVNSYKREFDLVLSEARDAVKRKYTRTPLAGDKEVEGRQ